MQNYKKINLKVICLIKINRMFCIFMQQFNLLSKIFLETLYSERIYQILNQFQIILYLNLVSPANNTHFY